MRPHARCVTQFTHQRRSEHDSQRSITSLAGATALVLGVGGRRLWRQRRATQAVPGTAEDRERTVGHGRRRQRKPRQRSSSTRRAARSTCSSGTPARRARAPAPARSTGRPCGRPASRRSAAERLLRSSQQAPAPTASHRSPTTGIRSTFLGRPEARRHERTGRERLRRPLVRAVVVGRRNHHIRRLQRRLWLLGDFDETARRGAWPAPRVSG